MRDDETISSEIKPKGEGADLSAEIAKAVKRKPREQVTCRRITAEHYRCNWWTAQDTESYDNPQMQGLMVTTSRICHSQFLHVTKSSQGLQIKVIAADKPRAG